MRQQRSQCGDGGHAVHLGHLQVGHHHVGREQGGCTQGLVAHRRHRRPTPCPARSPPSMAARPWRIIGWSSMTKTLICSILPLSDSVTHSTVVPSQGATGLFWIKVAVRAAAATAARRHAARLRALGMLLVQIHLMTRPRPLGHPAVWARSRSRQAWPASRRWTRSGVVPAPVLRISRARKTSTVRGTDAQALAHHFAGQTLDQQRGDLTLARRQVRAQRAARRQVLEGPDAGGMRHGRVQRAPADVAPEQLAAAHPLHHAVVGVAARARPAAPRCAGRCARTRRRWDRAVRTSGRSARKRSALNITSSSWLQSTISRCRESTRPMGASSKAPR